MVEFLEFFSNVPTGTVELHYTTDSLARFLKMKKPGERYGQTTMIALGSDNLPAEARTASDAR
jgi:hypothetical protein